MLEKSRRFCKTCYSHNQRAKRDEESYTRPTIAESRLLAIRDHATMIVLDSLYRARESEREDDKMLRIVEALEVCARCDYSEPAVKQVLEEK